MIVNFNKSFLINFLLIFLIFLVDRISKIYVINLDKKFLGSEIFSSKFLNISLIWNEGIAFGLLAFDKYILYNLLSLFIGLIIMILIYMAVKNNGLKRILLLMIISGALGNLFDRIYYKAVPDFIDFHIGNFHWFIFNVSDIFITIGVIGIITLELIQNKKINDEKV
jgi:signal peptidase II